MLDLDDSAIICVAVFEATLVARTCLAHTAVPAIDELIPSAHLAWASAS
jgi:hypothetical protein